MKIENTLIIGAFALLFGLILGLMFSIMYGRSTVVSPSETSTSGNNGFGSTIIYIIVFIISITIVINAFS
jgi:hypothetical protein